MKIGSLFSGMAGLDQAVEAVTGATPAWFVEYESAPSKILAKHYPDVPNYGDITKVDWTQVEPIDILTGGFPCQDLSLAGKRAGLKVGTRSGLWFEFVKAIEELKPRMVVIENVRGILSAPANSDLEHCPWCMGDAADRESTVRALGVVVATLAAIGDGYDVRWQTVRASDAGAPHRRERVFIIGIARGGQELMPTPLTTSGRGYSNPEVEAGNPKKRLVAEVEILRRSKTAWGKFEPVIRHWEDVMGRPAPEPTIQVSEEKRSELNPAFVEWMMSLPEGWVTGNGLSTKEELKILGNGVVPMQAALALRLLLGLEKPAERERERVDSDSDCVSCIDAQRANREILDSPGELLDRADWQEPRCCPAHGARQVMLPTPTVSDTFTSNLKSSQQKEGSMHSITLPQAVERLVDN